MSLAGCSLPEAPSRPSTSATTGSSALPTPSSAAPASEAFRFATASDGHLGQPGTRSRRYLAEFVRALNKVNDVSPVDVAVINGDIGHGGKARLLEAKAGLDRLDLPYLVTQGNHDRVSASDWREIWGTPLNVVRRIGDRSMVLVNTSNWVGDFRCADVAWLQGALTAEKYQRDVFVFMHITPNTWTKYGAACPQVREALADSTNVRAIFNGHDHDQTGMKQDDGVHYVFDAHYGGDWGTPYRAFRMVEVADGALTTWLVTSTGRRLAKISISW